jgi:knotted carbamoyltransferase YgeW
MENHTLADQIDALRHLPFDLYGRDFLLTSEQTDADLMAIIGMAEVLKTMHATNHSCRVFDTGLGISIFRDQSTRTRFSFASACNLLGLALQEFDEKKSQVGHGETVRETANMIAFLSEVIGIRDDMFIGKGHIYMQEVGAALDDGYANGVLAQRPAIVNLQCDIDHPTQAMADLAHLKEYFGGSFEHLRGKRIAMTWAYSPSYGKPLSVPQGIITLMTRLGMDVVLAHPEGYDLLPDTITQAERFAEASGGKFRVTHSMASAFKNADVVYPKSWAPFSVMEERTKLYALNDDKSLKELERQCLLHNAKFKKWECTEKLMKDTKRGRALYMHCLPADISGVSCAEGEVSAKVFERYRLDTYREASYKPFVIAAMILGCRFRDPATLLDHLARKGARHLGLL